MKSIITLLVITLCLSANTIQAAEKVGVLLMHGKGGTSSPKSPIGPLIDFLDSKGILVSAPNMPWSRERGFDKTYEESMAEINEKVMELRKKGASKIVVAGHSIGANAALGYGARYDGIDGIIVIAPGHTPEVNEFQSLIDNEWKRAKKMVESGNGDKKEKFKDVNQGRKTKKKMRANVYLSWFNPNGPAVMPVNTTNIKPGVPLLWILGEKDRMYKKGKSYAFNKAPSNSKNAYTVVKGGHKATPQNGKREILNWLNNL